MPSWSLAGITTRPVFLTFRDSRHGEPNFPTESITRSHTGDRRLMQTKYVAIPALCAICWSNSDIP